MRVITSMLALLSLACALACVSALSLETQRARGGGVSLLEMQQGVWNSQRDCPRLCDSACACADSSVVNCASMCESCLFEGIPCGTRMERHTMRHEEAPVPRRQQQQQQQRAQHEGPRFLEAHEASEAAAQEHAEQKKAEASEASHDADEDFQKLVQKVKKESDMKVKKEVEESSGVAAAESSESSESTSDEQSASEASDKKPEVPLKAQPVTPVDDNRIAKVVAMQEQIMEMVKQLQAHEKAKHRDASDILPPHILKSDFGRRLHHALHSHDLLSRYPHTTTPDNEALDRIVSQLEKLTEWVRGRKLHHGADFGKAAEHIDEILRRATYLATIAP